MSLLLMLLGGVVEGLIYTGPFPREVLEETYGLEEI